MPKPKFKKGQVVYRIKLDKIKQETIKYKSRLPGLGGNYWVLYGIQDQHFHQDNLFATREEAIREFLNNQLST